MEVYSTGEILKEKLQQKAQVRLPLLQKVHGEHAWMEVHRFLDDDGAECVCARLHVPNVDAVRAMRLPKGVVVKDELAIRQFLSRTPVQPTREKVLEQVMLQVVSQKGNEDLLGACPHVDLLDLAGVFYIPVKLAGGMLDGFGRLQWTDLNDLELSPEELYAAARENTVRHQGVRVIPEGKVFQQTFRNGKWIGTTLGKAQMRRQNCYVVSNREHSGGGALILVPEVLEALEEKMGGPFFIAFTVLDGLMMIRDDGGENRPACTGMALRALQYWPSGVSDRLYRFERSRGLQFAS